MLYIKVISKNKREGTYFHYTDDKARKLYTECARHRKSNTASRVELITPTGEILQFHDYE